MFLVLAAGRAACPAVGSELSYFHHRYYDPELGRFLTPDPIDQSGAVASNRYTYANSAPSTYTDPQGLSVLKRVYDLTLNLTARVQRAIQWQAVSGRSITRPYNTVEKSKAIHDLGAYSSAQLENVHAVEEAIDYCCEVQGMHIEDAEMAVERVVGSRVRETQQKLNTAMERCERACSEEPIDPQFVDDVAQFKDVHKELDAATREPGARQFFSALAPIGTDFARQIAIDTVNDFPKSHHDSINWWNYTDPASAIADINIRYGSWVEETFARAGASQTQANIRNYMRYAGDSNYVMTGTSNCTPTGCQLNWEPRSSYYAPWSRQNRAD